MIEQAKSLLDQILNQGGADAGANAQQTQPGQSSQFDLGQLLEGKAGLATGAIAGGLAGLLLGGKGARKIASSALKLGGAAVVGGLAYKAYRDWQAGKAPPAAGSGAPIEVPSPEGTPFLPSDPLAAESLSGRLLRAMVAAAKADGHITDVERERISKQLATLELGADLRRLIEDELARPLDFNAVAALARTPEEAAEIYAASLLVVDPEGPAEKAYLSLLATRLKLDPDLVRHLHANVAAITSS